MKRTRIGVVAVLGVMLAAAGCTGTDLLTTANTVLRFEVEPVGLNAPNLPDFDCIEFELGDIEIRPLDGTCVVGANENAEGPCLNTSDCGGSECVGSSAGEVVQSSILFYEGGTFPKGNLLGTECEFGNLSVDAPPFTNPEPTVLSEGLYKITTLRAQFTGLYQDVNGNGEFDTPPDEFQVCTGTLEIGGALGDLLRFTIPATGEKVILLQAHIDQWAMFLNVNTFCTAAEANLDAMFSCETCDAGF